MNQKINEQIEVDVVFFKNKTIPRSFSYSGKIYKIRDVRSISAERKGGEKNFNFSVSDGINFFRLRFMTNSLKWFLEEMRSNY